MSLQPSTAGSMLRHFVTVIAVVLGSLSVACGSDSISYPTSVAGTWNLTSVNGTSLPYVTQASDPKLEVTSKQYVITDAGTFTVTFTLRSTELDGTVYTNSGTSGGSYRLDADIVTFEYDDNSILTAQVSGSTMTIATAVTQTFTKQ